VPIRAKLGFGLACLVGLQPASFCSRGPDNLDDNSGTIVETSVCKLAASPDAFDGKLIRIHAYMSRGFEDSTLHHPECAEEALVNSRTSTSPRPNIWASFATEAGYYKVKGYRPLVEDAQLKKFQQLLREGSQPYRLTGVVLIGTFYAGKPRVFNGHTTSMRGYGHMGCCSLFVISQVESIDPRYENELSYSATDWYVGLPQGCFSEQMLGVPNNTTLLAWQKAANEGQDVWHYDAKQTAEDELKELKSGSLGKISGGATEMLDPGKSGWTAQADLRPTETLLEVEATAFRKRYEWIEADHITRYAIVVSRPYWLLKVAGSAENVIWVPAGASVLKCGTPTQQKKKH